ncbi:cytidine deaminase-like protein [Guyanagaster necrorhizus]|uniref:Cytosine deaminase n=1 Tax=Guyanagaster necrorhizus TaxID=856835 RepID=A0A9P7VKS8_9AGAR|nr:cytidine deaminase-like protein [Guyanagaster necrorhizus MCA 3950]KAG7442951.1 cytidine deaminase-like protein [Guyanagaster necrorhizus MCA 3950]
MVLSGGNVEQKTAATESPSERDLKGMQHAIEQARIGFMEGGIPIGAVLMDDTGEIIAVGRNRRVQENSAIKHGETDCLNTAGRLPPSVYSKCTMYTTLSPCPMCSGACLLFGIPRVVIGENTTFTGPESFLKERGVEVINLGTYV